MSGETDRGFEVDLQTGLDIVGYSLMVFSAGMGFVAGSLILTFIAKHIGTKWLIGIGRFLSALGYLIYALAPNL